MLLLFSCASNRSNLRIACVSGRPSLGHNSLPIDYRQPSSLDRLVRIVLFRLIKYLSEGKKTFVDGIHNCIDVFVLIMLLSIVTADLFFPEAIHNS
jgi:hypothetical protein